MSSPTPATTKPEAFSGRVSIYFILATPQRSLHTHPVESAVLSFFGKHSASILPHFLLQLRRSRDIEFRIIFLDVADTVFRPEFLDHRRNLFRVRQRTNLHLGISLSRLDPHRWILEHILIPLLIRALHRQ